MKGQPRGHADRVAETQASACGGGRRAASTVARHTDPRLHGSGGNLDARRIARRLGVPLERLAAAVGYTPQGLFKNPTSDRLQAPLAEIAHVLGRLGILLAGDRSAAIWLRAPHPDLGGATPLSYVLAGRASTVAVLLHLAEAGQTT